MSDTTENGCDGERCLACALQLLKRMPMKHEHECTGPNSDAWSCPVHRPDTERAANDLRDERDEGRKEAADACRALASAFGGAPEEGLSRLVALTIEKYGEAARERDEAVACRSAAVSRLSDLADSMSEHIYQEMASALEV